MDPIMGGSKKRVCYFFDSDIGNYHYGPGHPMKPTRIRMCHSLVMNYGLYKKMEIFRAKPATKREMTQFHTDEYVDFLYRINPDNAHQFGKEQVKYNVGDDCPVFDGLFEYCSISAGGSMEGAARLSRDKCDIAVNWAGGLHHAKKAEASGFCYVNDIVLGILELLRYHQRVLYIDIDVHHGDGVEEAFYTTDRVMSVSFHKYGEFFPGTGEIRDNGIGKGKGYAVNVPLRDGIRDDSYKSVFEPTMRHIIEWYRPGAIVLQCGADSLSGDWLGPFNLSMRGHANCVSFIRSFNLPLLMLGGGGYTVKNVSRAWAYETGIAAGVELQGNIPNNEYFEYYGPEYELDVRASNMTDHNTPEYLDKIRESVVELLRSKVAAPSVQMHSVPKLAHDDEDDAEMEDEEDKDDRKPMRLWDKNKQHETSLSDSEDEGTGNRKHRQSHKERKDRSTSAEGKRPRPSGSSPKPSALASTSAQPSRPDNGAPSPLPNTAASSVTPPEAPQSALAGPAPPTATTAFPSSSSPKPTAAEPISVPVIPASDPAGTGTIDASTAPAVAIGNPDLASGGMVASSAAHTTQTNPAEGVDVQSWVSQVNSSRGDDVAQ